jgi:hypothetical protein
MAHMLCICCASVRGRRRACIDFPSGGVLNENSFENVFTDALPYNSATASMRKQENNS